MPVATLRYTPIITEGRDSFVEVGIVFKDAGRTSGHVDFQVSSQSTALRGSDFIGNDGQIIYDFRFDNPGDVYLPLVKYSIINDFIKEPDESLVVHVTAPNWTFENGLDSTDATILIKDNDYTAGRLSNDFNGDGRSDIFWRETGGAFTTWLGRGDGELINNDAAAYVAGVPNEWRIAGSGDFNGDGRSDILFRNDDGRFTNWLGRTDGGLVNNDAAAYVEGVPTSWRVAGVDDFNGDGRSDILWRNTDGLITNWLGRADGGATNNDAHALALVETSWQVAGTGDFNGDGQADILWRHEDGRLTDWLGRADGGFTNNDGAALAFVPTSWRVVGSGDFNGDGRSDILWRNSDGGISDWLGRADGGFANNDAAAYTTSVPTSWHVADTGDYNGDGRFDVLWRNDDGSVANWLAREDGGFGGSLPVVVATVPNNWHIQNDYPMV